MNTGCFMIQNDCFYLLPSKSSLTTRGTLSPSFIKRCFEETDAFLQKKDHCYKITPVHSGRSLDATVDFLIVRGELVPSYCYFCIHRLEALISGCERCTFTPRKEQTLSQYHPSTVQTRLQEAGYFEAHPTIFTSLLQKQKR